MSLKKIFMYFGIIILILFICYLGYLIYINTNNKNELKELIPQEELSDDKLRQTIITLYFLDEEKNELIPEARKIDSKDLLENPYRILVELLIEGPKNEKLTKLIQDNTKINNIEINSGIVSIDFSENFIDDQNSNEERQMQIINSILKTLKELTEVNGIKILINGEENKSFPNNGIKFNEIFE